MSVAPGRTPHKPQTPDLQYFLMPPVGIEPTTFGLKVRCSAS
jgi:hypothetical protein